MADQSISVDEHPLFLELKSTRTALSRFQEEAHAASVKLQRHSLDAAKAHERAVHLERENDVLKAELAVLRATPQHSEASSAAQTHIQELTLSLRQLSQKITLTEEALLEKTSALVIAQADTIKARASQDTAYELGARMRGREEAGKLREVDLEWKIKELEDAARISDVVMGEYAALVRDMEARAKSSESSSQSQGHANGHAKAPSLSEKLFEGKLEFRQFIEQFRSEFDQLQVELLRTKSELEVARSELNAEKKGDQTLRTEFARTKAELDRLRVDDGTAAKMVARYMQFSQSSTNSLLASLETLKTRHAATLSTLSSQNHLFLSQVRSLESQNEHLRTALDDLGGEIMKEKYGRRREVGLRIRMGGREERVVEGLRRWVRRGEEALDKARVEGQAANGHANGHAEQDIQTQTKPLDTHLHLQSHLHAMAQDARILLENLEEGGADEETALSLSGARAREMMVRDGIEGLLEELRAETEQRVSLEARATSKDEEEGVIVEDEKPPAVPEKIDVVASEERVSPPVLEPEPDQQLEQANGHPTMVILTPSTPETAKAAEKQYSLPDERTKPSQETMNTSISTDEVIMESVVQDHSSTSTSLEEDFDSLATESTFDETATSMTSIPDEVVDSSNTKREDKLGDDSKPSSATSGKPDIKGEPLTQSHSADPSTLLSLPINDAVSSERQVSDDPPEAVPSIDCEVEETVIEAVHPSADASPLLDAHEPGLESELQELPEVVLKTPPHPLLAELGKVNKRYDDLQRAFRDCHIALEGLKSSLSSPSSTMSSSLEKVAPVEVLSAATGRLDDYTEDVRVELEIRVGDEVLLSKGYEALLSVPGALGSGSESAYSSSSALDGLGERDSGPPSQNEVEKQIVAFVDGTDPTVKKARETFARKLEDVQHDIAALKRAVHDPESFFDASEAPNSASASTTNLVSPTKTENGNASPGTGGWSSWIRGTPSRPSTPTPLPATSGPPQTFGNIMTSPRLRHSPSLGAGQLSGAGPDDGQRSRRSSFFGSLIGMNGNDSGHAKDPLGILGLRVPMPSFAVGGFAQPGPSNVLSPPTSGGPPGFGGLVSPTYPSPRIGPGPMGGPRARTLSTMYMLGLGTAGGAGSGSDGSRSVSGPALRSGSHGHGPGGGLTSPLSRQNSVHLSPGGQEEEGGKPDDGPEDVE